MSDAGGSPTGASPSIECRQIGELLADYLDGTLPKQTTELIEWHMDGCGACVAFLNTYRGTIRATRSLPDAPIPPEFKKRLLAILKSARRD